MPKKVRYGILRLEDITWNRIVWITILFVFISIAIFLFFCPSYVSKHLYYWIETSAFVLGAMIALLFGLFTVGSYIVARRVEDAIKIPIKDYYDFVRKGKDVLDLSINEMKIMVWYPCFSLTNDVRDEAEGIVIDHRIDQLQRNPNVKVEILMNDNSRRKIFIEKMKVKRPEVEENFEGAEVVIGQHLARSGKNNNFTLEYSIDELPFHIFWSPKYMIFTALPKLDEYVAGPFLPCKGFESRDADIIEAFATIFDQYFERAQKLNKETTVR